MQNKKILVTGAGGFVGSHLARELLKRYSFVRAVDIKWDEYIQDVYYTEKLTLDLRKLEDCLKAAEGMDYVFNLAANMGGIGFITEVGADVMHDNILINAFIMKSCIENKVKRLFFSSSACVYPTYKQIDSNVKPLKEEDAYPADPDNFYGWEKLYAEKMLEAFKKDYGLNIRIARYHNIYGPEGTYKGGREKSPAALCRKVIEAVDYAEIEIWGDGRQTRSYCYIDDCVQGTIMLMESDCSEPLNIGADRLLTIDELADIIIKISGKKITKRHNLSAPQGVRGRNSDNMKVRQILEWEPKISLEEGLEKTYRWIEKQITADENILYKGRSLMKYLVTGGAGFIGSHVVDRLLEDGCSVIVIDNFSTGRPQNLLQHKHNKNLHIVEEDITAFEAIKGYFMGIDIVIHLAALADIVPSIVNPGQYYKSNVTGTFAVVEAARLARVKKLVYAASSSCYGIPSFFPTPETAEISLQYPYALTKYLGERIILHWGQVYKLPVVSLRLFNVYGHRSRTSGTYGAVFGVFLAQKLNGRPFTVVGDGEQGRDFIYASDVVEAFFMAANSEVKNEIFNIGSGNPQSINKLVGLLKGEKVYIPKRPGEPDCTYADITKVKSMLGWEPKVSFEEGVGKMLKNIDYWEDAPVWTAKKIEEATQEWFKYLTKVA